MSLKMVTFYTWHVAFNYNFCEKYDAYFLLSNV